jgi:hypothetical protein
VAQFFDCSPQSRTRYNFLYDGFCKDGQEKIERVIGFRGNGGLGELQRSLVITYILNQDCRSSKVKVGRHSPICTSASSWTSECSCLNAVSTKFGRLNPLQVGHGENYSGA